MQQAHVLLVLQTQELNTVLQVELHEGGVEGNNHLPQSAGHLSFNSAQDEVSFLGCKRVFSFLLTRTPKFFSSGLFLIHSLPVHVPEIALTQVQHLHLILLNCVMFTWGHFSSVSRSFEWHPFLLLFQHRILHRMP